MLTKKGVTSTFQIVTGREEARGTDSLFHLLKMYLQIGSFSSAVRIILRNFFPGRHADHTMDDPRLFRIIYVDFIR